MAFYLGYAVVLVLASLIGLIMGWATALIFIGGILIGLVTIVRFG